MEELVNHDKTSIFGIFDTLNLKNGANFFRGTKNGVNNRIKVIKKVLKKQVFSEINSFYTLLPEPFPIFRYFFDC